MRTRTLLILSLFLVTCEEPSRKILANRDFETDDWLLVNLNYVEYVVSIIDDEEILKSNADSLTVVSEGLCGETTCDGLLRLYRNGKLVEELSYLDRSGLHESNTVTSNYIESKSWTLKSVDKKDFNLKWDSLKNVKVLYPTYHTEP